MREKKQKNGQGQNRYSWQHLKEDLGAAVLPGLISDSASTVTPRMVRAAHR